MPALEQASAWSANYGLFDLNEDGIPELFIDQGTEVHTYFPNSVNRVPLFESMVVLSIYVDAASHQMMTGYSEGGECKMYSLYTLTDNGFEETESKQGDGVQESYLGLTAQMEQIGYPYLIGDEASLLEDLVASFAK